MKIKAGSLYFRNLIDLTSDQGVQIEAGSLWEMQKNETVILTLVNEDLFATCDYINEFFVLISHQSLEKPYERKID